MAMQKALFLLSSQLLSAAAREVVLMTRASPEENLVEELDMHGRQLMATRVAGVGIAIFIFFFFFAFMLVCCLLASRSKSPCFWQTLAFLVFIIPFLVIFTARKGDDSHEPPEGYNLTIVPMSIVMSFLCLGALLGLCGLLFCYWCPTRYARPLNHQADVMRYSTQDF